ncbi:Extracellular ligand-binding receptor [Methanocaldococcus villosus KIN24-T80]|uniref:Extracellular ligand-binding receptor n=1 Tax=Methanocaldococcus villosus KIN24-T80 TaxID=1069083 RepID=N6UWR4_9EURY|nr:ABC transporter substrate-binding protein [Methanocaldococcus villosus]ENN96784.1 Extracellular ligand-binding receptor [Methanocaldococcus villosus KIN24-T80]
MGLILITFLAGCTQTGEKAGGNIKEVKLGLLVDLSGSLATYGQNEKHACEIAEEKVNEYFKEHNIPYKVKLYVEDTKADPKICLDKVQALHAIGVNAFIGPMSSSEVKNVKSYSLSNKVIFVSQSSTADPKILGFMSPEEKKYIFRFVPTDSFQGKAIGDLAKELNLKNVIILYRKDAWGEGLKDAIVKKMKDNGINIINIIPYDPQINDWSPIIQTLSDNIKDKGEDTGVVFVGYEEGATLLSQINDNSPILNHIWIGTDGVANSEKIIKEVKDKAVKVKLYSTMFKSESEAAKELEKIFKEKNYGNIDQYALNAYDAFWVVSLAYVDMLNKTGKYDADVLSNMIKEVTKKYSEGVYGVEPVSGYIELNEWNDRASGDYGIFMVTEKGWKLAGIWHSKDGKIEWL